MSTLTNQIKLNPTTITIPRSIPSSSYTLKLGLTPHLLINEPLTSNSGIRSKGDAVFEVTVPVGGVIELEVEVDREGLGRVGGMEMSIIQEIELEEMIKNNIINSFRRNTAQLAIEEIRPHGDKTSYIIRPLASSADRSSTNAALISTYQPIALLNKIGLCLNWCLPINRDKESDESQSSNTDSIPSSDGAEDVTGAEENQAVDPDENTMGQLPVWANTQLQQALDQLFRTNLIRRFPLIFDPDLPQYIPSITKSSTLLHTLTRALALSASHRTNLFMAARPILNSLLAQQDRMAKHKVKQVSSLSRRGKAVKRIKGDTAEESSESQVPSPESQVSSIQEVSKEISVKLLSDAMTRIGFADYKARRIRGGKLGYRSIKLSMSDTGSPHHPVTSQSVLNQKMHHLHLDDDHQFNDFLDDDDANEHHQPTFEVYDDDDDLFLDSEDDDDGFLNTDDEDEFLDTDEEDGRMDGVDILGYPWPEQMDSGGDDWLDQPDDDNLAGFHGVLDFDLDHDHDLEFDNLHDQEPERSRDHLFDHDHLGDHDEFLDSDVEDQQPRHLEAEPPLSPDHHHPSQMDISVNDHHPFHDGDFLNDEGDPKDDFLDDVDDLGDHGPTSFPPSPTHITSLPPLPYLSQTPQYILPRSPQFSLGQAGAMISNLPPNHDHEQEQEHEFLDSDVEESEMGVYTADQYLTNPNPEPESEMGIYTADDDLFDSDPELESELGDYTADHPFGNHQDPAQVGRESESEMGVYTAGQSFESHQNLSIMSTTQPMSCQQGFWDDDEEVVYRTPSVPPDDMRHYQYPLDDIDDDFLMSDGDAMSIHSDLPITLPDQPEHRQSIQVDDHIVEGDTGRMNLDCSSGRKILQPARHFSEVLPTNNPETLDEAMPASPEFIDSDDDLF